MDFAYWWSFSGGGSAINGATPSSFCLYSDSSDSDSYSGSDSDGDSYSGWLWFHLWLGFVMVQDDWAGEYINF